MNGTAPPISSPMKTFGSATLMNTWSNTVSPPVNTRSLNSSAELPIVSMKLANSATAAITAEPIAKPLVTALVVLPTASRLTITACASPSNSPDISAIPAALSATGPNVSSLTTTPVVASMPMPVSATRYRANWMLPPPRPIAAPIATAIATTAHTDDSRPIDVPVSTVVAGPPPVAVGDVLHRPRLGRREVLGDAARHLGEHEADHDGTEHAPADVADRAIGVPDVRRARARAWPPR